MEKAYQNEGVFTPDNLVADGVNPINTKAIKIATGSATLERGTLLTAAGAMVAAASDVPAGILCEQVVQDAAAETESIMYTSGSFYKDAIKLDSSLDIADFETVLQNLGIFLR